MKPLKRPHLVTLVVVFLLSIFSLSAQEFTAGINTETPNPNAVLHLVSPNGDQGLMIPALTNAQRGAMGLAVADKGLLVFDSDDDVFYFWDGAGWVALNVPASIADGVDWTELTGIPAGFADGTDNGLTVVTSADITDGTIATADVANLAITNAKINDVAVGKITGAPNLDTDATNDVAVGTSPAAGDVSGSYTAGFTVDQVGGQTAANIASATTTVNSAPALDTDTSDDLALTTNPAAGDVSGNYSVGLTVDQVGGQTAANVAAATTTVNSAPALDTDTSDDLALTTNPAAGDVSGNYSVGLTVDQVGGQTAANVAAATTTVNSAPALDTDTSDDLALTTNPAAGDVSGNYSVGLTVDQVGGQTAANVAAATTTVNTAPSLDLDTSDDVLTGANPAAGDVSGSYTAGFSVDQVGGQTAANIASATTTVNSAPALDTDTSDDLALTTNPAAGDVSGNYSVGLTVDQVGGQTAANVAAATTTVNSAPALDTDTSDDLALTTNPAAGDVSGNYSVGLTVDQVGGQTAANVAAATTTVNTAPSLDLDTSDDVLTGANPAAGDVSGSYTAGFTVDQVGGQTAANIASATTTVNSAPALDTDTSDDLALTTNPAAGDVSGNYSVGLTVDQVGGQTAANVAAATTTVNSAPALDTDTSDDLALTTNPAAGDVSGNYSVGLTVDQVGGQTAANVAAATTTVNTAPSLDLDTSDDVLTGANPAAGDVSGSYTAGFTVDQVGGQTAANIASATTTVNGAPALDTDATDDLVSGSNISLLTNDAGFISGEVQDLTDVLTLDPDAGGLGITNLADPTLAQDAATKNYVDTQGFISGEVQDLTDVLTLDPDAGGLGITNLADPTLAQDAATKNYVDTQGFISGEVQDLADVLTLDPDAGALGITNLADPTLAQDAATKNYVDTQGFISGEVQDLTDVLTLDPDAGGLGITNLADPTLAQDAATKNYVDTQGFISGEVQDLTDVLTLDPDAGGLGITNLADPTLAQDAATKNYVDTQGFISGEVQDLADVLTLDPDAGALGITNLADPTLAQDAATKNYVDTQGFITSEIQDLADVLTLDPDAGALGITNLADPTLAQDAATKNYVDTQGFITAESQDLTITGNTLAITGDPNTDVNLSFNAPTDGDVLTWDNTNSRWDALAPTGLILPETQSLSEVGPLLDLTNTGGGSTNVLTNSGNGDVLQLNQNSTGAGRGIYLQMANTSDDIGLDINFNNTGSTANAIDVDYLGTGHAAYFTANAATNSVVFIENFNNVGAALTLNQVDATTTTLLDFRDQGGTVATVEDDGTITGNNLISNTAIGIGTAAPGVALDVQSTDAVQFPVGTTGERPGTPSDGMIRYNSTLGGFEGYVLGAWGPIGGGLTLPFQDLSSSNPSGGLFDVLNNAGSAPGVQFGTVSGTEPAVQAYSTAGGNIGGSIGFAAENDVTDLQNGAIIRADISDNTAGTFTSDLVFETSDAGSINRAMTILASGDIFFPEGVNRQLSIENSTTGAGGALALSAGDGDASSDGGDLFLYGGQGFDFGGNVALSAGNATNASGIGGDVLLQPGGSANPQNHGIVDIQGSSALKLPAGLDGERPLTGIQGMIRYNTTSGQFEGYDGSWNPLGGNASALIDNPFTENLIAGFGAGSSLMAGGDRNVLIGENSGSGITTGTDNVTVGRNAGLTLTTGFGNTLVGSGASAGATTQDVVGIGDNASVPGSGSIAIGQNSQANNIDGIALGRSAQSNADDAIAIGTLTNAVNPNTIILGDGTNSNYNVGIGTQDPRAPFQIGGELGMGHFRNDTETILGDAILSNLYPDYTSATDNQLRRTNTDSASFIFFDDGEILFMNVINGAADTQLDLSDAGTDVSSWMGMRNDGNIDIGEGIILGSPDPGDEQPGMIQWTGGDFEGNTDGTPGGWVSLTGGGGFSLPYNPGPQAFASTLFNLTQQDAANGTAFFEIDNATSDVSTLVVLNNGSGINSNAIEARNDGGGDAGDFAVVGGGGGTAVSASTDGTGPALNALKAVGGTGPAAFISNDGSAGSSLQINLTDITNSSPALELFNAGTGPDIQAASGAFTVDNSGGTSINPSAATDGLFINQNNAARGIAVNMNGGTSPGLEVAASGGASIVTDGDVGIGINAPSRELHLHNSTGGISFQMTNQASVGTAANNGFVIDYNDTDQTVDFIHFEGNDFAFGDGVRNLYIDNANNRVGIGTETPQGALDVNVGVGSSYISANSNVTSGLLQIRQDDATASGDASIRFDLSQGPAQLAVMGIDRTDGNTFKIAMGSIMTDGNADFAITPSGDVGIGTATPGSRLDVNGDANIIADATVGNLISTPLNDNTVDGAVAADSRIVVLTVDDTITDINTVADGKEIIIVCGGGVNATIQNSGTIQLDGSLGNFNMIPGNTIHLVYITSLGSWVEISRAQ
ncbi:beta strand repeat-containing protein [Ekhidna sp.]|uniref:beta strand repeat-containing protein n=1 Tax=Ekhidna sp. TaxID=2608089 RepID=UPI003C7D9FE4